MGTGSILWAGHFASKRGAGAPSSRHQAGRAGGKGQLVHSRWGQGPHRATSMKVSLWCTGQMPTAEVLAANGVQTFAAAGQDNRTNQEQKHDSHTAMPVLVPIGPASRCCQRNWWKKSQPTNTLILQNCPQPRARATVSRRAGAGGSSSRPDAVTQDNSGSSHLVSMLCVVCGSASPHTAGENRRPDGISGTDSQGQPQIQVAIVGCLRPELPARGGWKTKSDLGEGGPKHIFPLLHRPSTQC